MDYVLTYADRGFSGNPYAAGMDRTYSLDALPQEYPSIGTGDYRNIALNIKNEKGVESADLLFKSYEIRSGKYQLQGLPAVWADKEEAQTLEIVLADENAQVEVHLLYGVLEEKPEVSKVIRKYNARIVEVNAVFAIVEKNGMSEEITNLYEELRQLDCVLQFVRSGRVAITTSCFERVNEYLADREAKYRQSKEQELL